VLRLVASALGAYFGEVAIEAFGGAWVIDLGAENQPERWRVELEPPTLSFHPVGLAACAVISDEAPGYDDRITPPFMDAAALAQPLESRPPVDAEMSYSLPGRFEAIGEMRELLAEIARRRAAGPPDDEPGDEPN